MAPGGQRRAGQAGTPPSIPATQRECHVSFSLREEFLGPSHCCPIPWIPPDNKVERAGRGRLWAQGVCAVCPPHLTAYLLSCAGHPNMGGSMQRMNPPRGMGPMGPGPQVTTCLSVHLPGHLCAPAYSPLSTVCQSFRVPRVRGEDMAKFPAAPCPRLGWPHAQPRAAHPWQAAGRIEGLLASWGRGPPGSLLVAGRVRGRWRAWCTSSSVGPPGIPKPPTLGG